MRMLSPNSNRWSEPRAMLSPSFIVGDVFEDFDRMVDSLVRPSVVSKVGFLPSCDIVETKQHYLVSFDLPGVSKDDIKIEVKEKSVSIAGERRRELNGVETDATLRHERSWGKFERTFELPSSIQTEKIEAHYENGVLNVALPKVEAEKARTVQIQSGEAGFFSRLLGAKRETGKDVKDIRVS